MTVPHHSIQLCSPEVGNKFIKHYFFVNKSTQWLININDDALTSNVGRQFITNTLKCNSDWSICRGAKQGGVGGVSTPPEFWMGGVEHLSTPPDFEEKIF